MGTGTHLQDPIRDHVAYFKLPDCDLGPCLCTHLLVLGALPGNLHKLIAGGEAKSGGLAGWGGEGWRTKNSMVRMG